MQEMELNACEASADSCSDALGLLCSEEATAYRACGNVYCRSNPTDSFCVAICEEDPSFCS